MSVEVFFDYTCGFSNRARRWLDRLDGVEVVWRPFSLLEQRRHDDGPPMFQRPDLADNVSLIALAVHEAVRADGGDVAGYRRRMFTAWHEEPSRLSTGDILGLGREAGLGSFEHDSAFAALAADHARAKRLGVFGTPTLAFGPGEVAFVKLDDVPAGDRAWSLWETLRHLAVGAPVLREWQRVTPPQAH
ncbi:Predicted dithiol-disulfide isomerase, DsbA family [Modestobacter sp. DSM 44400]|uniref:DsbA family protein n=1 Tax=Modestobacter sp. DSM 44400 TaxID=1550230 RepID=UPI00089A57F7|nr:DsbA family protein [Modestobacter sp. DSM 44400]SDX59887.1 Predicted dithiol-disulfide isomerase, DsbA family [Modestobacter sp. DSM 44400]